MIKQMQNFKEAITVDQREDLQSDILRPPSLMGWRTT